MKFKWAAFLSAVLISSNVFAANVAFSGKVTEIRRETSSITCGWSDTQLIVKITGSSSTKNLRIVVAESAYKDMLSMLLTAYSSGIAVNIQYDNNTDPCTGGSLPSDGILKSLSLVP